jgi:CheY-like chemotaxis protein
VDPPIRSTTLDQVPSIQHWLVPVAREAGLEGADQLDIGSDSDLFGVWDAVAMRTGVSAERLTELVAAHYRLEVADLENADPHAHKLIPAVVARKLNVIPLGYTDRVLEVATADPVSMAAERELGSIAARHIHFSVAPPSVLQALVREVYPENGELQHEVPPLTEEAKGGPHILVVDDDPSMRTLVRTVLEGANFRVSEASDGPEALEMLSGKDWFALVTLDLQMNEMHGLEVLQRIRSRVSTAALPVIVATGSDDPEVEMQLFEAGADDFVVKPVDAPRFLLRVQAVLRRRSNDPLAGLF